MATNAELTTTATRLANALAVRECYTIVASETRVRRDLRYIACLEEARINLLDAEARAKIDAFAACTMAEYGAQKQNVTAFAAEARHYVHRKALHASGSMEGITKAIDVITKKNGDEPVPPCSITLSVMEQRLFKQAPPPFYTDAMRCLAADEAAAEAAAGGTKCPF